jgi:hypothetical protein
MRNSSKGGAKGQKQQLRNGGLVLDDNAAARHLSYLQAQSPSLL